MKELLNDFTKNVGKSKMYSTVTNHYYQLINGVKEYASNDVRFGGSVSIEPTKTQGTLTFADTFSIIYDVISNGLLPNDPEHGLYGLIHNGNLTVYDSRDQPSWPDKQCGYHSTFPLASTYNYYVVGDPITKSPPNDGCMRSHFKNGVSPNNNLQADNIVKTLYHELVEAVAPGRVWGWNNNTSFNAFNENMDCCTRSYYPFLANTNSTANVIVGSKKWLIQNNWIPTYGCTGTSPYGKRIFYFLSLTAFLSFVKLSLVYLTIVPTVSPTKKPVCNTPNKKPESKDPPKKPINNKHYPTKKPVHKPEGSKKKPISAPSERGSSSYHDPNEKPTTNHNHQNVQSGAGMTGTTASEGASGLGNEAYIGIAVGLLVFISLLLFAYFWYSKKARGGEQKLFVELSGGNENVA